MPLIASASYLYAANYCCDESYQTFQDQILSFGLSTSLIAQSAVTYGDLHNLRKAVFNLKYSKEHLSRTNHSDFPITP